MGEKIEIKEELLDEIDFDVKSQKSDTEKKVVKKEKIKDEPLDEETEITYDRAEKVKETKKKNKEDIRMTTRPRRDSTSSLSAAVELKAKKEDLGDLAKLPTTKEVKKKSEKNKDDDDSSSTGSGVKLTKIKSKDAKKKEEFKDDEFQDEECNSDLDAAGLKKKKSPLKSTKSSKSSKGSDDGTPAPVLAVVEGEEVQHLEPNVECQVGDKIKVFWRHGQIYEAKIMKAGKDKKEANFMCTTRDGTRGMM